MKTLGQQFFFSFWALLGRSWKLGFGVVWARVWWYWERESERERERESLEDFVLVAEFLQFCVLLIYQSCWVCREFAFLCLWRFWFQRWCCIVLVVVVVVLQSEFSSCFGSRGYGNLYSPFSSSPVSSSLEVCFLLPCYISWDGFRL